jgi:pimeloyl-ACP methyl ester carboxylesterase
VRALQAQDTFEALAEREGFVVVYANGAPGSGRFPSSGVWQTDPGANRAIDDFAYLALLIERLQGHLQPPAGLDVYLVGYGSGARLALEAAAGHPERYAGVAAFLPNEINRSRPPPRRPDTRLSRLLFVTLENKRPWAYWPGEPLDIASLEEWVVAVGLPRFSAQRRLEGGDDAPDLADSMTKAQLAARQLVPPDMQLLDFGAPENTGPAVRVLVAQRKSDIAVMPGGRRAPVDAATLAWEFLRGAAGTY